ncbi:MAG: invasin domain 3-containing protein [Armatimonadota bacterium]
MPRTRRHWGLSLSVLLALALPPAAHASTLVGQLTLSADSLRVPADGRTPVAITIEVLDATGRPVSDGTSVNLVTTLGEIVSPVQTIGGMAQTVLTPSTTAGTALVSAMVGSARETVEVEFVGVPGSASPGSRMVELSADELSYNADRQFFIAGPNARLSYETIVLTADGLEYDVMMNVIRAQGSVVLRCGSNEIRADALRYDLFSLRGRLLRAGAGEPEWLLVEGESLATRPDASKDQALWEPMPAAEYRTWVKARSAVITPRKRVILDHAAVFVDDMRVMGLRRHVFDLRQGPALFGNSFGYSTLMGPSLDFPYYYRATANQLGVLHLTRNRAVGGLGDEPGWAIGLREEYFREGKSEGWLSLKDITDPTKGIDWQHQLKLGAGSGLGVGAGISTFEADGPRLRSAGLMYYRPVAAGRLSLSLSASDFGTSEHSYAALSYRVKGMTLGSGVIVSPAVSLRHSRRHSEGEQVLIDPETGQVLELSAESWGRTTSPGLDVDVSFPSRPIAKSTELNASMHTGYAWGLEGGARSVFDARLGVVRRISHNDYVRLDYSYSGAPASLQPSPFSPGRQRLSLNGNTTYRGFSLRFNASQEIGGGRLFGYVSLVRPLPWGRDADGQPLWGLHANHLVSHVSEYKLASTRLALSRRMGQYRLAMCYSPQGGGGFASQPWISLDGYGYTYSGGRHFWLELSAAGY